MSIQSTNLQRSIAYTSSLLRCIVPHGISSLQLFFFTFFFVHYPSLPFADAQWETDTNDVDGSLSPSQGIIVIILLSSFFLTRLLSMYIRWCAGSPSNRGTVLPIIVSRDGHRGCSHGLDKSVIERFPTFLYSAVKELKIGQGCLECAVCLNEFEDHEKLRLLPKCNHVFHPDCIGAWLVSHTTCPVCRANLVPSSHETELVTRNELTHDSDSDEMEPEAEVQLNHVQIIVGEGQNIATGIAKQRKRGNGSFTRSYSTDHSLIRPGQDCERFTLRLPDEVRKQLMIGSKLKRAASFVVLRQISSSRRGYRSSDDGGNNGRSSLLLGHSNLWALRTALPLVGQTASVKVDAVGVDGDVTAATSSKWFSTAVVTPLDG